MNTPEITFTVNAEEAATRLAREALASIEPPTKKANP